MTEPEFLSIVASVRDVGGKEILDLPVRDTALDSLDLATLRSSLEVRMARPIPDDVWSGAATLRQLLDAM